LKSCLKTLGLNHHRIAEIAPKAQVVGKKGSQLRTFWRDIYKRDRTESLEVTFSRHKNFVEKIKKMNAVLQCLRWSQTLKLVPFGVHLQRGT
jgi:hypothetical protein